MSASKTTHQPRLLMLGAVGVVGLAFTLLFALLYWHEQFVAVLEGPVGYGLLTIVAALTLAAIGVLLTASSGRWGESDVSLAATWVAMVVFSVGMALLEPTARFLAGLVRAYAPTLAPLYWFGAGVVIFGSAALAGGYWRGESG